MATLEELVIKLEADNAKLVSALEESAKVTARSSKQMEEAISKFSEESTKKTGKFSDVMTVFAGTTLANLAVKGAQLAAEAFGFLKDQVTGGITESMEFEQQMVRLANSMAMSGKFSAEASKGLEKYIGDMETLSGIDDAVIAGNLAMLSSITRLDSEGLQRAQTSALNLSAALGVDLSTATKMVAKAAEGNTDAFKKYGIVIEGSQDKTVALENTLRSLETRFGGAAGGAMKTFQGSVLGMTNSFGNLFQAIGDVVVKNPAVIAGINEITKIMSSLTETVTKNAGSWSKDLADAVAGTMTVLSAVAYGTEELVRIMVAGLKTVLLGIQATIDGFQALGNLLTGDMDGAFASIKESEDRMNSLTETVMGGGNSISNAMFKVAEATTVAAGAMDGSFDAVKPTIQATGEVIKELSLIEQMRAEQSKSFADGVLADSISVQGSYQMQQDALALSYENQTLTFETFKAAKLASQMDLFLQEEAMLQQALGGTAQYEAARLQLEQSHGVQRMKLQADLVKQEAEIQKLRLGGYSTFFGGLAVLTQSSNKELASIGKAAAISQATIDAYLAIQNALATVPYPANIAAAVGIGVQAFANVAKISGVGLAKGIDSVPGVGTADNFPAVLAPGERVVPAETNKDLTEFLARGGGQQSAPQFNLNFYGPVWGDKASAGAEIVEAINEALARGMSLRILNA